MSPILWTTMMTGVSPLEHRILDFTRFSPVDGSREPIGSDDRLAPAVWNVASWAGRKSGVFGLWATYPAEEIAGMVVSDRLSNFLGPRGSPPPGSVSPASRLAAAGALRERVEGEVGLAELRRFLPGVSAAEFERARAEPDPYAGPVPGLWRMLVETRLQDELFRDFVEKENPDLAILYLEATDIAGHLFSPYMAPRLPTTSAADFERFQGVPPAFYGFVDELLGRYAELAKKRGAALFLASDHGFLWGEGRPARAGAFSMATAPAWHHQHGIYLLHGPGIPARARESAPQGIRRVAATILALAGLAPGVSITGPPLPPVAASVEPAVDYSQRFRSEIRAKRPAAAAGAGSGAEELAKLRSLGYLGESEFSSNRPGGDTRTPGSYSRPSSTAWAPARSCACGAPTTA